MVSRQFNRQRLRPTNITDSILTLSVFRVNTLNISSAFLFAMPGGEHTSTVIGLLIVCANFVAHSAENCAQHPSVVHALRIIGTLIVILCCSNFNRCIYKSLVINRFMGVEILCVAFSLTQQFTRTNPFAKDTQSTISVDCSKTEDICSKAKHNNQLYYSAKRVQLPLYNSNSIRPDGDLA